MREEVTKMNEKKLLLIRVDEDYCNFLRKFDNKVAYNYDYKKNRPFVGVLFEINDCKYFAPLSSPKPKHLKLKSKIDFLKIDGGRYGAVNFNNMIPVSDKNVVIINIKNDKYGELLKRQIYWLNRHKEKLYNQSKKLYSDYICGKLNRNIAKRCCNFKLLEEKCEIYNK